MLLTYWKAWLDLSVSFPSKFAVSDSFGTDISNLTFEDSEALNLVLPHAQQFDTRHSFYLFAANMFRNTFVYHEVYFSKLAIQTAPPTADTALLWNTVVNGLIDLALYEDAYASIMATPYDKQWAFYPSLHSYLSLLPCLQEARVRVPVSHSHV
jgi:hypothetical protein